MEENAEAENAEIRSSKMREDKEIRIRVAEGGRKDGVRMHD
jgi:hypothetical protein